MREMLGMVRRLVWVGGQGGMQEEAYDFLQLFNCIYRDMLK